MLASPSSTPGNAESLGCELSLVKLSCTIRHGMRSSSVWGWMLRSHSILVPSTLLCKLLLCDKSSDYVVREENAQADVTRGTVD